MTANTTITKTTTVHQKPVAIVTTTTTKTTLSSLLLASYFRFVDLFMYSTHSHGMYALRELYVNSFFFLISSCSFLLLKPLASSTISSFHFAVISFQFYFTLDLSSSDTLHLTLFLCLAVCVSVCPFLLRFFQLMLLIWKSKKERKNERIKNLLTAKFAFKPFLGA